MVIPYVCRLDYVRNRFKSNNNPTLIVVLAVGEQTLIFFIPEKCLFHVIAPAELFLAGRSPCIRYQPVDNLSPLCGWYAPIVGICMQEVQESCLWFVVKDNRNAWRNAVHHSISNLLIHGIPTSFTAHVRLESRLVSTRGVQRGSNISDPPGLAIVDFSNAPCQIHKEKIIGGSSLTRNFIYEEQNLRKLLRGDKTVQNSSIAGIAAAFSKGAQIERLKVTIWPKCW